MVTIKHEQMAIEHKTLNWTVRDEKLNKEEKLSFSYSAHSYKRTQERSLSKDAIATTLEYGKAFFKQGLIFYVLGSKRNSEKGKNKTTSNMVVVVSGDSELIITCYKNRNPFKYIRKKTKYLC